MLISSLSFDLHMLGYGFSLTTGSFCIAIICTVDDVDLSESLKMRVSANWEVASGAPGLSSSHLTPDI